MMKPQAVYELLLDKVAASENAVEHLMIGVTWTLCQSNAIGLAMSPGTATRTLPWSGSLTGRNINELAAWIRSWDPYQATVAMAAINSILNTTSSLMGEARWVGKADADMPRNLAVFEHFLPSIRGKKVVVVGRYPGLERYRDLADLTVLERWPENGDLPDAAAEYVLPEADWVFLTGTSLINKTFPRLAELARAANVVLMGPTVPWLREFADFGIDYLAGVAVVDEQKLRRTVAEGGGVRIFNGGVCYAIADLRPQKKEQVDVQIADLIEQSDWLQQEMESWQPPPWHSLASRAMDLAEIYQRLDLLDARYRELWEHRVATQVSNLE